MAKQHFYSRVPSRMSMFLKVDGFDTFACSKGIPQEYFEKDMIQVLEQKPTLDEISLIRNNELPPVYMAYSLKDGTYIHSCLSYIPQDYTKERTSYMVHSLIYDEEELDSVINKYDYQLINTDLFLHNLDSLDVLSSTSRANNNYDELTYVNKPLSRDISYLTNELDVLTLKKCIFAILGAITNKYKSVYIILPIEYTEDMKLEFYNSLIQIFPYHLRYKLSFVSRVNDYQKYSSFNIKLLDNNIGVLPTNKGVLINFREKTTTGIKDIDLKNFGHLGDFFYSLLKEKAIREEFLVNTHNETLLNENLKQSSLKEIEDIIQIFKVGCSFYNEFDVLPNDDAIISFFSIYEKYRDAISNEYRIHSINVLQRYPNGYIAIPKNVFNKIAKIYQSEIYPTKHIIMNVCLELIHSDLMRPMLFNFMKNNYALEDKETQERIITHLANVFYGGFLQLQIIEFFDEYFENETISNRFAILEKLYLAIRTKEIQEALFNFVSKHYSDFNKDEKILFFEASAEHLAEGDELAKKLLYLCDSVIGDEETELQNIYSRKLYKVLDNEYKIKEQLLLPLISTSDGYTFKRITEGIYTKWKNKKITYDFIALSCTGTMDERIHKIIDIWTLAPSDVDEKLSSKVTKACVKGFNEHPANFELEEIFNARNLIHESISSTEFVEQFDKEVLEPLIDKTLLLVFKSKQPSQVETVIEKCTNATSIHDSDNYKLLITYLELKKTFVNDDFANALRITSELYKLSDVRNKIASYLEIDIINSNYLLSLDNNELHYDKREILALIMINYLRTNQYSFDKIYQKLYDRFMANYPAGKDQAWLVQTEICMVMRDILSYASLIYKTIIIDETLRNKVLTKDSGIISASSNIIVKYSKNQLKSIFKKVNPYATEVFDYINNETKKVKTTAKLFAKIIK